MSNSFSRDKALALACLHEQQGDAQTAADIRACVDMLDRARVVGVLDGFQREYPGHCPAAVDFDPTDQTWSCCIFTAGQARMLFGTFNHATPDEARAKAAAAIEAGEV